MKITFQVIEMNILKDSFRTATLTISETDSTIDYSYQFDKSLETYKLSKKDTSSIETFREGNQLISTKTKLETKVTKNSRSLGDLHRLSQYGVQDGNVFMDSGSKGLFSLRFGLIYLQSNFTRTGEIISSIDNIILSEKDKYDIYYR